MTNSNIKAILDISSLCAPYISGIGVYTQNLLSALAGQNVEVFGHWRASRFKKSQFIKQFYSGEHGPFIPYISALVKSDFQILHGPDFRLFSTKKFKKVLTIHDMAVYQQGLTSIKAAQRGQKLIEDNLFKIKPDAIIAISEFSKSSFLEKFPQWSEKVHVVYHGADHLTVFQKTSSQKISDQEPYFLFVGNLEARKNLARLLRAYDQFYRDGAPLLKIVGRPGFDYQNIFETYQQMKNKKAVQWQGFVSNQQLQELYQNALAFLYPSLYEGFGIPILEAFIKKVPVLTSNITATAEVAQKAALLIDPYSEQEIIQAMERLASDSLFRQDLIESGIQRAKDFSWSKCGRETAQVYRSLL